jgi:ABC-type bacteriocin/lantibiotic exporter with double-glycine peptidase domain
MKKINTTKYVWLLSILKKDTKYLWGNVFLGLFASLLGMAMAIFSQKLIDFIVPGKNSKILVTGLCIAASIMIFKIAVTFAQQYLGAKFNQNFNQNLINEFFERLMFLPRTFFDKFNTGVLIARMNDSYAIQKTISYFANTLILNILILIVSTSLMFAYSVEVAIITLLAFPLYFTLALFYKKKINNNLRMEMDAGAKKENNYITTIQNIDIVKTHNQEEVFSKRNKKIYGYFQQRVFNSTLTGTFLGIFAELIGTIISIAILTFTSCQMLSGMLTVGKFAAIISINMGMFGPIATLGFAILELQGANVAFDRMYEFMIEKPEYALEEDNKKMHLHKINKVEVKNLYFSYEKKTDLLININFTANKGEMLCIWGENGSGKSTILKLLMSLYKPDSGEIKFDGINIDKLSIQSTRDRIALVAQQSKLFNTTIIENICLSSEEKLWKKAIVFLNNLGFDRIINNLPDGYMTKIHENGSNLSGGQKQIISLGRAMFKQPDILLVDEPTASLDNENELFVLDILKKFKKYGTIIMVSHKHNPAKESDFIMLLKNGVIEKRGKHHDLIEDDNLYSKSYSET